MRNSNLAAFALVLLVAIPAQAKHAKHSLHKPATAKAAVPVAPQPTPVVLRQALPSSSRPAARVAMISAPVKTPAKLAKKAAVKPVSPVAATTPSVLSPAAGADPLLDGRLARITAYYTQEDYYTSQHMSSTGVHLKEGHCAVDPRLIPYGSVVTIPGMGNYTAVDTGSAVVSREAAVGSAHNSQQRNALVVDLFFENRKEAEQFAAHGPSFVSVSWKKPLTAADAPLNPRALPANSGPTEGHAMMEVYVLASAPSLAESRMPLAFRSPVCSFQ